MQPAPGQPPPKPIFAATYNQKGGTGKTTTVVNLAAALGELGLSVLVVDTDPSADASGWLGVTDGGKDLLEVFTDKRDLASIVRPTTASGVEVAPSSPWMHQLEQQTAGEPGREMILREAFAGLPASRWDVVLVDCPPAVSLHSITALTACPELIVPVATQHLPLKALANLARTVQSVKKRLNPELRIAGVVPFRYGRTKISGEVVAKLREAFPETFETIIRENTRTAEASSHMQPITAYDPEGAGTADYRDLALELLMRWAPEKGSIGLQRALTLAKRRKKERERA